MTLNHDAARKEADEQECKMKEWLKDTGAISSVPDVKQAQIVGLSRDELSAVTGIQPDEMDAALEAIFNPKPVRRNKPIPAEQMRKEVDK